ncbi:MAG TPA: CPBP family intramembrane metalloprotease, partial [Thermoanaerobaculales bacterium]|nr:CPBP family intramembrane metalloprotease [Thermoanaerobaculales bacterium]
MFRKPWFWVAFVLFAVACATFGIINFPKAFPIVTLDLEMDREAALEAAGGLADRFGWGPAERRHAASFDLDRGVQSFVELEAGGREAFSRMLAEGLYSPYTWRVRHFAEFEANETLIRFTPAGKPFGFVEMIPEEDPGAALEPAAARAIAETAATRDWGIDLGAFERVEDAQEVRPSGRVDHTFVYERPSPMVGEEGRYRLRLVVTGDRFTELTNFVKVPEAFERRYEEMRSANNGIATGAAVAAALLYVIGGCVIGTFLLLRKRWVLWKHALAWGLFIAGLQALVVLNQWPLAWMGYDTAISATNFALEQVVQALLQLLGMGLLLTLSFMAAESLTRRAFPNHLQLWRVWSPGVAGTKSVAGQTAAGYLLVAVFLAFDVALYLFASRTLGWWNPSDALYDPNVIANYLPWLSSVAISLQAGFWEECLFRAIPIASAALLGQRFGGRKWWILGALVLQALIFGGGHANYPAQPAYARLVELILPAVGFGLLYLVFGLVPAIVLHFAYDVMWFAIPLFAASTPGIWVDRALVLALTLVPLLIVLARRIRAGRWGEVAEADRNLGWQPAAAAVAERPEAVPAAAGIGSRSRAALVAAGVIGLAAWFGLADFRSEVPALAAGRSAAVTAARAELAARGITIPEGWRALSAVEGAPSIEDRFVWQEGGAEAYRDLLGSYVAPPRWLVRFTSFEGDVVERAEEYQVSVGPDGAVERFSHRLPESRAGAQLESGAARELARQAVAERLGLDAGRLNEVSAEPEKRPERIDWRFVLSDKAAYPVEQGDARVAVEIGGDEVVDAYRFVHVPEDWERGERNRGSAAQLARIVCTVAAIAIFVAGGVIGVVRWSKGRFSPRTFALAASVVVVLGLIGLANSWPSITAQFSSAQPFALQAGMIVAGAVLLLVASATAMALAIGLVHRWVPRQPSPFRVADAAVAGGLGLAVAGAAAAAGRAAAPLDPTWPAFDAAGAASPFLAAALDPITGWIAGTALLLLILTFVEVASRSWTRWRVALSVGLVLAGLVLAGSDGVETVPRWLAAGLVTGLLLW